MLDWVGNRKARNGFKGVFPFAQTVKVRFSRNGVGVWVKRGKRGGLGGFFKKV